MQRINPQTRKVNWIRLCYLKISFFLHITCHSSHSSKISNPTRTVWPPWPLSYFTIGQAGFHLTRQTSSIWLVSKHYEARIIGFDIVTQSIWLLFDDPHIILSITQVVKLIIWKPSNTWEGMIVNTLTRFLSYNWWDFFTMAMPT